MLKKKIVNILNEIADLLELQGVQFKPRAYRRGARAIAASRDDIMERYEHDTIREIDGVGKSMEKKVREIIETGSLDYLEKLREEVPAGLVEVMKIPDIGPKHTKKLYEELGIEDLESLKASAEAGEVAEVKGFGEKTQQKILHGIAMLEKISGRHLISEMLPVAEELVEYLRDDVERIEYAGSLRRRKETIGDIDILATGDPSVMDRFTAHDDVEEVLVKGETKSSVRLLGAIQVDLRLVKPESFGSALQYFTGSVEHNIQLRRLANDQNYKLSEYGLFEEETNERIEGETEEGIYDALGLQWIPPELREDAGEIDAAGTDALPDLVTLDAIRGDLQSHSDWSDGHYTVKEMAAAAQRHGYDYLAITDHSAGLTITSGMDAAAVVERDEEIGAAEDELGFHILSGIEVDIKKDGTLDMDDETLEGLDIVLGAVHSYFKLEEEEQTARIVDAFSTGLVDIFAHPTGRKIGEREPYDIDIIRLVEAAKQYDVVLEINASPIRLDLHATNARIAHENGVLLSLGTDAHRAGNLDFMRYGVDVARRAWLEPDDIINTRSYDDLISFLK